MHSSSIMHFAQTYLCCREYNACMDTVEPQSVITCTPVILMTTPVSYYNFAESWRYYVNLAAVEIKVLA